MLITVQHLFLCLGDVWELQMFLVWLYQFDLHETWTHFCKLVSLRFSGLQLILLHHRKVNFAWSEVNVWSELWLVSFLISIHNLICIDEILAEQVGTGKWRKGKVLIAPPTLISILKTNYSPVVFTCFYYIRKICFLKLIRLYTEIFAVIF